MLNIRSQEINVTRASVLEALKRNRDIHIAEFKEAVTLYQEVLIDGLTEALEAAKVATDIKALRKVTMAFNPPSSYVHEYTKVIDLIEASTDETFSIDGETFQAYYKNQWTWTNVFNSSVGGYQSILSSKHQPNR